MTIRNRSFVDLNISGSVEKLTEDNTLGLVTTHDPERFPDSLLLDPERLERALIAVREEFDNPGAINLALIRESEDDDDPDLAIYPENERGRAVVIAPRHRRVDGGGEPGDLQSVTTDNAPSRSDSGGAADE